MTLYKMKNNKIDKNVYTLENKISKNKNKIMLLLQWHRVKTEPWTNWNPA